MDKEYGIKLSEKFDRNKKLTNGESKVCECEH